MRRRERCLACLAMLASTALLGGAARAAAAAEPAYRYRAPITLQRPGAFVQLPLPASVYAHGLQAGLADLRIVDAHGERVPFAVLPPPPQAEPTPPPREARFYALPRQRTAGGEWSLPVTVAVDGHAIRVQPAASPKPTDASPPGWLIDLGEPPADAVATSHRARTLTLAWAGPSEFSAAYDLQTSTDLRHWSPAAGGQLMALRSPAGPLTQPLVLLPADGARFVRLVWRDPAAAPQGLSGRLVVEPLVGRAQDAPSWLVVQPSPASTSSGTASPRAIDFDLGGPVPVTQVDLDLGPGNRVLPLQIEGRASPAAPWRLLTQGVVFQLARDGQVNRSPPLAMTAALRYLRVVPDERSAAPPREMLRLRVQVHLPRLVFATQGQLPFTLLAGSTQAKPGALPVGAVVPALEGERARFGEAALGAWEDDPVVARAMDAAAQRAAWRPWVLWAVLLAGVAVLGAMVWRLQRSGPTHTAR